MEKKHISIIGSCVSREMFNSALLGDVFTVDTYAFKICVWDLFGDSLGIPDSAFDKIEMPSFFSKMLRYGMNKITLEEIKNKNSEYLLIDLFNIKQDVDKLSCDGKSVYIQDMYDSFATYKKQILKVDEFSKLQCERILFQDLPEAVIVSGLEKLANWAKTNWSQSKIIINNFAIAESYYSFDNKHKPFDKKVLDEAGYDVCEKYARILHNYLPDAIFLEKLDSLVSQHALYDNPENEVSLVHFTNESYVRMSEHFIKALNIDLTQYYDKPFSPLGYECCILKNSQVKLNTELKKIRSKLLNFSEYIEKYEDLNDFIFIFSSKDGVVCNAAVRRALLVFEDFEIPKAHKFVAIIDRNKKFCEYKTSPNQPSVSYHIERGEIVSSSMGWGSTSKSEVKVFGKSYLFETKGLNLLVLNSKTFEVFDSVNIDTDNACLITWSEYIRSLRFKIM